jgi:hypothetical protein
VGDVVIWTRDHGEMCVCGHPTRAHHRLRTPLDECVDGCDCQLVRDPLTLAPAGEPE